KGGVGLIGIEGSQAAAEPPTLNLIRLFDERCIPGLRRVADMVHEHGARIVCEIFNRGSSAGRGPSNVPNLWARITPRPASVKEIRQWVREYGISARNVRSSGLDGVELLATHGVCINQFLSPLHNRRVDEYGGPLQQRMAFLLEIIDSIRA